LLLLLSLPPLPPEVTARPLTDVSLPPHRMTGTDVFFVFDPLPPPTLLNCGCLQFHEAPALSRSGGWRRYHPPIPSLTLKWEKNFALFRSYSAISKKSYDWALSTSTRCDYCYRGKGMTKRRILVFFPLPASIFRAFPLRFFSLRFLRHRSQNPFTYSGSVFLVDASTQDFGFVIQNVLRFAEESSR